MKQTILIGMSTLLVLSSCSTHSASGAYIGSEIGHIVGASIGDLTGGRRGYDIGTVVGTLGGMAVGAAVGAAIDDAENRRVEEAIESRRAARAAQNDNGTNSNGGTRAAQDNNGGYSNSGTDDIIDFDDDGSVPSYTLSVPQTVGIQADLNATFDGYRLHINPAIELRNARIIDENMDGVLVRDEQCKVVFEIMNNSERPLFDIQPQVMDVTANKHVYISPNITVESIEPHRGIRYTATIKADHWLKDGELKIRIGVVQGNREITSQIKEFTVPTRKRAEGQPRPKEDNYWQ